MFQSITPQEAHEKLTQASDFVYLDVRSVEEFSAGHPLAAKNIPILEFVPSSGRWLPNERFLDVMEAHFPKDTKLIVGCKSGGRSASACQVLAASGYKNLWNMDGGFSGRADPGGRVLQPGWLTLGLPVEKDGPQESRYETLAKDV